MKTLFNNKGISLVILIVAMTLIGVLGASFVSLMGSKQKGFLYQINSYRALTIANAGVEYAIRYISDGLSDTTNPSNNFFNNPGIPVTKSFAAGTFVFTYSHTDNRIVVTGNYPDPNPLSRREVRLSNFRRYLSPITLIPYMPSANRPRVDPNDSSKVIIPVICNNENQLLVTQIDVATNAINIYLYLYRSGITNIFDFNNTTYPPCGTPPTTRCWDMDSNGQQRIYWGSDSAPVRFALLSPNSHNEGAVDTYTFQFSSTAPVGQYAVTFNPQLSPPSNSIVFVP